MQTCVLHTSRSQPFHRIVRDADRVASSSAAAGKMRRERVRKRANPPRVAPPEPESDDVPDEEWLDESPLKKLLRDDDPPDEPWLLLDEAPRGGHSAWVCSPDGAAIPGRFGSQLSPGISA